MNKTEKANTIHIRPASEEEAELLAWLNREAFRDVAERLGLTPENCPGQAAFCTAETVLADMAEGMSYRVLEHEGRPYGCVATGSRVPDTVYMKRLCVLPEYRHHGFGRMLVEWVIAEAQRLHRSRVEFGVFADNKPLVRWYEGLGFTVTDTRQFEGFLLPIAIMCMDTDRGHYPGVEIERIAL